MNCKPGDLAIVVKSAAGNEGRIVRCIKEAGIRRHVSGAVGPAWEIDVELPSVFPINMNIILDEFLRPIRDPGEDAQDETLSWLPVPVTEGETA